MIYRNFMMVKMNSHSMNKIVKSKFNLKILKIVKLINKNKPNNYN